MSRYTSLSVPFCKQKLYLFEYNLTTNKQCCTTFIVIVAEQVVNNSPYLVMGQELTVVFAEEESLKQEPSNLLLKNIPPDTDIDFLELYMDSATGLSGSDGDYQLLPKPGGLYLVVFNSTLGKKVL